MNTVHQFKKNKSTYYIHSVLFIGYGLLVLLSPGVALEGITQKVTEFMSGSFFTEPFIQFGLKDYIGVNYIYKWLYLSFPYINWYPLSFFLLQFLLSATVIYLIIHRFYIPYRIPLILQVILSSILLLLLFTHQIFLEHNSTSLLYGTIGIWLLLLYPLFSFQYIIGFTAALISLAYRPEATTGVILLTLPALFIYRTLSLKKYFIHLSPILVILLVYHALFIYTTTYSNEVYYQLEPDFEYEIMDKRNVIPISQMYNSNDSIKYLMVNSWLLCDPDTIHPQFIRSIITNKEEYSSKFNLLAIYSNTQNVQQHLMKILQSYEFVLVMILISTFLFSLKRKSLWMLKTWIYVISLIFIIIFTIASIDTNLDRLFFRTVLTIGAFNIFFCTILTEGRSLRKNIVHYFLLFGLVISLLIDLPTTFQKIHINNQAIAKNQKDIEIINTLPQNTIVYMGGHDILNRHSSIFATSPIFTNNKEVINLRFAQYYDTENHREILSKITGQENPRYIDILKYIKGNNDNILIIGSPEALKIWNNYNKIIYGIEMEYSHVAPDFNSFGDLLYVTH